jgi:putative transposase
MKDKACIITGATAGIGLETAARLGALGARLLLVGRSREKGNAALAQLRTEVPGIAAEMYYADLSRSDEVLRLAAALGYNITKRTVANYLKRIPHSRPTPGWRTFLQNHMHDAAAIDMFVVISMSFKILFAFIVLGLDRRKILHVGATEHPTQNWLASEITEAFTKNPRPNYLIRDRDRCYGRKFSERVNELGIHEHVTAKQSPWQNIYAERVIWTIRRECLDHVIVISENHLRRILVSYADYYNRSRTHYSLGQDCPIPRPAQPLSAGIKIISIPRVGGLHHRYMRS